jgi:hypothetical protein
LAEQSRQAASSKCRPSLIKRRPRESGFLRRLADGELFGLDPAQHLVLDLRQVVGIEKAAVLKEGSGDGFGVGMQRTLLAEKVAFGLLGSTHS